MGSLTCKSTCDVQGDGMRLQYDAAMKRYSNKTPFGEQEWKDCNLFHSQQDSDTSTKDCLPTKECVVAYLNDHVAHSLVGVQKIVDSVATSNMLEKQEFLMAVFLLKLALKKAQESVFDVDSDDDDDDKDDSLSHVQKKISYEEIEEEAEDDWKINTDVKTIEQKTRPDIPVLCLDHESLKQEEACGPLGQGLLSMRGLDSVDHVSDENPWNIFDVKPMISVRSSRNLGAHGDGGALPVSGRNVSLASAYKKLIGPIPGTSILPLTETERKTAIESFVEKGYEHSGGMPIRDAIEMYHKLNTGHVHFSKVWALVDPQTVCKIDRRCFCAFIALVQSIVQQGESVKLPNKLSDEDISRLTLEVVPTDTACERSMHLDLKNVSRHHHTLWDINTETIETPRTLAGTECSDSDFESDDGVSVVSRMPSLVRSIRSISFRGMKNAVIRKSTKIRYDDESTAFHGYSSMRAQSLTSHGLDAAAWRDIAGEEHTSLELTFLYAALGTRRKFGDIFAEFELRDSTNRLLMLPIETNPGVQNRNKGTVKFDRQVRVLGTTLKDIPPGATLFFSLKQWKESKNKMSTIAWSYVDCDMVCDFGSICRVRQGNLALPLFKKPMDLSKNQARRLNGKHPCLYVSISGR